MAKSETQIDELRASLRRLQAEWDNEIAATLRALESQQSAALAQAETAQTLKDQAAELTLLRQRLRERDQVLDHFREKSKAHEARFVELEIELGKARAHAADLERRLSAAIGPGRQQQLDHQEDFDAMRAELAARKSLIKSLRGDADRTKALENELRQNRGIIASLQQSIDLHSSSMAELRRSAGAWEQKYRQLAEAGKREQSRDRSDSAPPDTAAGGAFGRQDPEAEVDGSHTIVIDMTEPLREVRDQRRRRIGKR